MEQDKFCVALNQIFVQEAEIICWKNEKMLWSWSCYLYFRFKSSSLNLKQRCCRPSDVKQSFEVSESFKNQQYCDKTLCEHNESQQRLIRSSEIVATAKKKRFNWVFWFPQSTHRYCHKSTSVVERCILCSQH